MPTKPQVLGGTHHAVTADPLGIHSMASGMPADGSEVPTPEEQARPGVLQTASQHLADLRVESSDAQRVVHARMCPPDNARYIVQPQRERLQAQLAQEHRPAPGFRSEGK